MHRHSTIIFKMTFYKYKKLRSTIANNGVLQWQEMTYCYKNEALRLHEMTLYNYMKLIISQRFKKYATISFEYDIKFYFYVRL